MQPTIPLVEDAYVASAARQLRRLAGTPERGRALLDRVLAAAFPPATDHPASAAVADPIAHLRAHPSLRTPRTMPDTPTPETTLDTLAQILVETFGVDREDVTPEATLAELALDSLDEVELVMAIEERFGIEVPNKLWPDLRTVGQIAAMIDQNGGAA